MKEEKAIEISVVTIFPDSFPGSLAVGIIGKALGTTWNLDVVNLRDFTKNGKVDERPVGGGEGMLLSYESVSDCFRSFRSSKNILDKVYFEDGHIEDGNIENVHFIFPCPQGKVLDQEKVKELYERARTTRLVFLCGRYEGVDSRVLKEFNVEELSLGDYVLCGGEVASMVLIEAVIRTAILNRQSIENESFSCFLLEHRQFSRTKRLPQKNMVPRVLFSGNHKEKEAWYLKSSMELTFRRRKDLWFLFVFMLLIFRTYVSFKDRR